MCPRLLVLVVKHILMMDSKKVNSLKYCTTSL